MTPGKRGAGFATVMWSLLFFMCSLSTALYVNSQRFGMAVFFGFCALYCLLIVRVMFEAVIIEP